ncbi:hypothetical protein QWY31_12790 [Cytophagales bacterium LB-30]|uniref:DUF3052 domain-containing protein n=1 Tax=Shiella aurantiaca TaxID=3058365 RepID=A0ABT8F7F1_9BACT|nr:hypothetical protein [Shiella aurantiaca]MDN4166380.1 hypothetical protein [Shiella aurantiaca]
MTPLFKKLNFKESEYILVMNAPDSFEKELAGIASFTKIQKDANEVSSIDFVMVFALKQEQIDTAIAQIVAKLNGDAIVWFCYPKGTSKRYTCDFNRDTGWAVLGKNNLEPVRQVAIDEDWSALRFRKTEYIKTLTRSRAISAEGKERIKKTKSE